MNHTLTLTDWNSAAAAIIDSRDWRGEAGVFNSSIKLKFIIKFIKNCPDCPIAPKMERNNMRRYNILSRSLLEPLWWRV